MIPRTAYRVQLSEQATQTNAALAAARKLARPCSEPGCTRVTTDVYAVREFPDPMRIVCKPCFQDRTRRETRLENNAQPRAHNLDLWDV